VILAELTGDESIVDIPPPKREVTKPSAKDQTEWSDSGSRRRKVKEFDGKLIFLWKS
jgi:hypothetical protein